MEYWRLNVFLIIYVSMEKFKTKKRYVIAGVFAICVISLFMIPSDTASIGKKIVKAAMRLRTPLRT